jgi:rhodanese-related sulfurtransferase
MSNAIDEITVRELKKRLDNRDPVVLIDVREEPELQACKIQGCMHIRLSEVPDHVEELDPTQEYVIYCHTGARSALVTRYLRRKGFKRVRNLKGGIDEWALQVDPSMVRY